MTCLAITTLCPIRPVTPADSFDQWRRDRLTEARSIFAEAGDHPASLVVIAARVVVGLTGNAADCAEAIDILRIHDPGALFATATAALQTGGAA